jgi:hypothetical protein
MASQERLRLSRLADDIRDRQHREDRQKKYADSSDHDFSFIGW